VHPLTEAVDQINVLLKAPLSREANGEELLRRPEMSYDVMTALPMFAPGLNDQQAAEQVEIQIKYQGYISRQQEEIDRQLRHENTLLPIDLDYLHVPGLSNEVIAPQRLNRRKTGNCNVD
jgi:tRNA uridine 5-carboxymethylaminomethyl modification enzyme